MNDKLNPTTCADCSYPPNFAVSCISKKTEEVQVFSVKCRDCGDEWKEQIS